MGLLAADLATDATTTIDDLAAALGSHAGTETDRTASFDVADSSWVVHCHRQISINRGAGASRAPTVVPDPPKVYRSISDEITI